MMLYAAKSNGRAVVIGAGVMGSGISSLLANSNWDVVLLDIAGPDTGDAELRNQAAIAGRERVRNSRPPLLYLPEYIVRIQTGNIEDNAIELQNADWIIEAVAEKMTIKQSVMAMIQTHANDEAIISTNTSGLSLRDMTQSCSLSFKRRFLGTHFFNPPRYLPLIELIRLHETDSRIASEFVNFAEQRLGFHVVEAKDTPGFISNRIGTWHLLDSIHVAEQQNIGIEEADYLTGALLGRPKSGTFRLADLIGFDVLADIALNQYTHLPHDWRRGSLLLPKVLQQLIDSGRLGQKTGAGFYKKENGVIHSVDFKTLEYHPARAASNKEADILMNRPISERLASLKEYRNTRWGHYVNTILENLTDYVRVVAGEIAQSPISIDQVMQWGFGWQIGPCAISDVRTSGSHETRRFFAGNGFDRKYCDFASQKWRSVPLKSDVISLADLKTAGKIVRDSTEASLIDVGEDVACLEFHTKMNTFTPQMSAFLRDSTIIAEQNFAALVIGNQEQHWSAGYNLNFFLKAIDEKDWNAVEAMLFEVQFACLGLKYARIPVVAAIHGYTLGAGCECALRCAAIQAAPELYIGLPESLVGVLPAGGGTTEWMARAMYGADERAVLARLSQVFDRLTRPKTSSSAFEARRLGWLQEDDGITREPDRLLFDARRRALDLRNSGYNPPVITGIRVPGAELLARLRVQIYDQYRAGKITSHDRIIFEKIAFVLSGGGLPYAQQVSEETLLRLERDAFIELAQEPKTAERMRHILATGKPLKN